MESELLTVEEVAKLCNRSVDTVRYWRYKGLGPRFARMGRRVMARRSDVLEWIDAQFAD
jgi:excisionase family DNA binding protein